MKYMVSMGFEVLRFSDKTLLAKFDDIIEVTIPSYASQDPVECMMHVENQTRLTMFYRLRRGQLHGFPHNKQHLETVLYGQSFIVRGELLSYRPV